MVTARNVNGWTVSASVLFGMSPKINFKCGKCGKENDTRISISAIEHRKPYAVCVYCGEVNDTRIKY